MLMMLACMPRKYHRKPQEGRLMLMMLAFMPGEVLPQAAGGAADADDAGFRARGLHNCRQQVTTDSPDAGCRRSS